MAGETGELEINQGVSRSVCPEMPYARFKQQVQRNAVALISVFIAVSSLSYNTWRNEKSEYNRNLRMASFELLLKLGELRELVYHLHYDKDAVGEDAARTGGAMGVTMEDLE